jgi:hypothetical protein
MHAEFGSCRRKTAIHMGQVIKSINLRPMGSTEETANRVRVSLPRVFEVNGTDLAFVSSAFKRKAQSPSHTPFAKSHHKLKHLVSPDSKPYNLSSKTFCFISNTYFLLIIFCKMKTIAATILLSLASFAYADNYVVQVGATGLTFSPNSVTADAGDTIEFVVTGVQSIQSHLTVATLRRRIRLRIPLLLLLRYLPQSHPIISI